MGAMKKLLALVLVTPFIQSNPTGAWREDMYDSSYSYGGGIWPYLLIGFVVFLIYAFFANWYDEYKEKKAAQKTEFQDIKTKMNEEMQKDSMQEIKKEIPNPVNKSSSSPNGRREPIYILIILVLCMLMYYQYSQYRLDSHSRVVNCFRDVVPDNDLDFCESFYEKHREPKISMKEAEKVIIGCWDEQISYCKKEDLGDECTFGAFEYCAVKHPEHWKIMEEKD